MEFHTLAYVEFNLAFPDEFLGAEIEVPTLALVVLDVDDMSQILIGTNFLFFLLQLW